MANNNSSSIELDHSDDSRGGGGAAAAESDGKRASHGKRQQLTFAEKNQLRQHHATISSSGGAAKQSDMVDWVWTAFGKKVGRSSIGRILSSAVDVEEAAMGPQRMRKRFSKYPDVEAALLTFVLEQRENLALLTDDVLWDRARSAAGERPVSMSWIQRFKRRNGVQVKRRSLLTAGDGDDDSSNSAQHDAFVAALTKNRDELLRYIHIRSSADTDAMPHSAPAKDALVEETDDDDEEEEEAVVAAAAAAQEARDAARSDRQNEHDAETEHNYEPDESDADASKPLRHESNQDDVATTPEAALPPRRRRDSAQTGATTRATTRARVSASPRFAIISQTTGRVELENCSSSTSEQPVSRESSPVRPSRTRAVALPLAAASAAGVSPSSQPLSSFMMPARSTAAVPPATAPATTTMTVLVESSPPLDQSPDAAATATPFTSPYARASVSRRTSLGGTSSVGGSAFDEQLEEERKRKVELEEREIELRVEGLRCDNLLKRIKIAEENMLARKRLRDAGIAEDEINEMLPVVKIHQL